MIKHATVTIAYVIWREGRPRFEPGPALRKLGHKGRDLKHQNGTWFTYEEAAAESAAIQQDAQSRKAARAQGKRLPRLTQLPAGKTLSQLNAALFALPEFQGKPMVEGKKVRKALSSVTVAGYLKYARLVQLACDRLDSDDTWNMPAVMIGPARMQALLNEIEKHSGLHQARKARGFLSTLWTKLAAREPGVLKGLFLELDKMPTAAGRVRPWEAQEFWAMVDAAEKLGRHDMADAFFWGLLHGDRQTDRLDPTVVARTQTHITLRHSKTGVTTTKLIDPWLQARFAANQQRRAGHTLHWPQLIIDEQAQRPWHPPGNHYAHVFAAIRKEAAKACPSVLPNKATGHLGIRDQDLRDTNQTWLDRASIDPRTMALLAGHAHDSNKTSLQNRHYVAINQSRMDNAVLALSQMLTDSAPHTVIPAKPGTQL